MVSKAIPLKLAFMEGTHPYMPRDLWLYDILINKERHSTAFTKAFQHQI